MCLILFAWKWHEQYPLVLAANRDEFVDRPSAPADFWPDAPDLLAGRDLKEGGTWLGLTRSGRLAAITNYRDPAAIKKEAPSRGSLVSDYLRGSEDGETSLRKLAPLASRYNGFSLLLGSASALFFFSNRGGRRRVDPGIHGMSNHLLDTAWPKVGRGKQQLERLLASDSEPSPEALLELLADRTRPADDLLPDTGVGLERERFLAPLFIEGLEYRTRSSTAVIIDRMRNCTFVERVFGAESQPWMTARFAFRINA
jgi:uncharacterized protein with NRDE domain